MSLVCPVCVCVFYVCVNMCVCALCVFGVSFKVWSFFTTTHICDRDPEIDREQTVLGGSTRCSLGAVGLLGALGSGDRDWGVVKGVQSSEFIRAEW